jgi:predicted transcriptional regulator
MIHQVDSADAAAAAANATVEAADGGSGSGSGSGSGGGWISGGGQRGYKEIMFDIALSIGKGRALKAHLMSDCRISYQRVNFYLSAMTSAGLIVKAALDEHKDRTGYALTDKGKRWIRAQLMADRILEGEEEGGPART